MQLSQEEIVLNLFSFHKMVVTNLGYPVYEVEVKNSTELERVGIRIKKRQNLSITVYLTINGIANKNCYFMVDPYLKKCYSYCFFGEYNLSGRTHLEKLGVDVDYWIKKLGYKSTYESSITLADIFTKLLPATTTHWEHMKYIIDCDIDWYDELFRRKEKMLSIINQAERYIRLTTNKFKTTI
jgi:hypothetical protein